MRKGVTTGDLIYKMTKIPDIVIYWFQWMNDYIIPYMLVFATAIFYFSRFDRKIMLAFVAFLAILVCIFIYTPRACIGCSTESDKIFSKIHEMIEDIIHNMPSVYTSNSKGYEFRRLAEKTELYRTKYSKTAACARTFKMLMVPLITGLVVFFVLRSRTLVSKGTINKGRFVSTFVVLTSMIASIFWVVDIMRYSVFDIGCIMNMDKMLEAPTSIDRTEMPYPAPKNVIGLSRVAFYYGDKKVFKDLSIDFPEGKTTVLLGDVGSGKTTILKILLGFQVPQSGDAYLEGHWYKDLKIEDIRRAVGYVPQNPVLFNRTVLYNVTYGNGLKPETVANLFRSIGLDPEFMNKEVGKNGMHLSGGQRQLVWCLRVLLKNPRVLLMDEPTASMDQATKDSLLGLIKMIMKGRTVIMVTHDPYLIEHADNKINIS